MSKKLLLVRHAKSDWNDAMLSDYDRPLNARGRRDAPEMAGRLLGYSQLPQQLVSSSALRAITTARAFAGMWQIPEEHIVARREIYEATVPELLKVINSLDNKHDFIALFGHNPGISAMASYLTGSFYSFPTCACVMISFEEDNWAMLSAGMGKALMYDFPKNGED